MTRTLCNAALAAIVVLPGCSSARGVMPMETSMSGARVTDRGKPQTISLPFTPAGCTYDDNGNFFVDGYVGSTVFFDFAEPARGSGSFNNVTLDKRLDGYPGGVRWDGSCVDIVFHNVHRALYRVEVSQYRGHVAGVVHLKGFYYSPFDFYDGSVVGSSGNNGRIISMWPYPAGGKPTKTLDRFAYAPLGLAVSAASAR